MTERVTAEDLNWAAMWMLAYEGGEDGGNTAADSPDSTDPLVQRARRVAAWMDAEVARREATATERTLIAVAKREGLPATDPRVRRAVRRSLRAKATP